MARLATTAQLALALAVTVLAITLSMGGTVAAGLVADNPGGVVRHVDPGGLAWRAGVRVGQSVVAVRAADEPGGGAIETQAESGEVIRVEIARAVALAEWTRPVAFIALGMALWGFLQQPRRRLSEGAASLAAALASAPIAVQGSIAPASVALPLAVALPTLWLVRWAGFRDRTRIALILLLLAILGPWLALRTTAAPSFVILEAARLAMLVAVALAMVSVVVGWRQVSSSMLGRPRLIDAATVAILVSGTAAMLLARVPLVVVTAAVILVALLYPALRRRTLELLDRAFLAEQRERLTLAASERERARLARDLHDAPLQKLAGVIKRLDTLPGAEREGRTLRDVAQELRTITTQLHPPVLDDLGLVAAVEFLIDQARDQTTTVTVRTRIEVTTGLRPDQRPAADVELNLFRIVQEGLANALRHSGGSLVQIRGEVSPTRVVLVIEDDGSGISPKTMQAALKEGRLGIASMRRRAEAIGASCEIGYHSEAGTQVRVHWEAD